MLPVLIFRILTFPKKNIVENIMMIVSEFLIICISIVYFLIEDFGIFEEDSSRDIFVALFAIFIITVVSGTILAILFNILLYILEVRRQGISNFKGILKVGKLINSKSALKSAMKNVGSTNDKNGGGKGNKKKKRVKREFTLVMRSEGVFNKP